MNTVRSVNTVGNLNNEHKPIILNNHGVEPSRRLKEGPKNPTQSSHIVPEGLQNIRVENFSPNLTAHVQPMDQGII